jgi:hypothetical protein
MRLSGSAKTVLETTSRRKFNSNGTFFSRKSRIYRPEDELRKVQKNPPDWFDSPDLVVILKATIGKLHTACAASHDAVLQCRQPGRVQFSGYRRLKCSKLQGDPLMFRKTLILAVLAGASLLVAGSGKAQAFHHFGGGCGCGGGYEGGCGGGCGGLGGGFAGGCGGGCGFHHHHLALFHHHCGCGQQLGCGCGAPAPSCGCGAPAPAPSCCAPAPTCCAPAPSCCAPTPSCGAPAPSYGASAPTTMTPPPADGAVAPPPPPGTGHPVAPPPPPEEPTKPTKPKA